MTPKNKKAHRSRGAKIESYAEWEARIESSVSEAAAKMKAETPTGALPMNCEPAEVHEEHARQLEEYKAAALSRRPNRYIGVILTREEARLVKAALLLLNCVKLTGLREFNPGEITYESDVSSAYSKVSNELKMGCPPEQEDGEDE